MRHHSLTGVLHLCCSLPADSPTTGAGGLVSATLAAGMDASLVTSTFLLPASALASGTPSYSALSSAFANR